VQTFLSSAQPGIFSHLPMSAFTIMSMFKFSLPGGPIEKTPKSLCMGSNLSAKCEIPPRDQIRSARLSAGIAAIEFLG
jgi:hypothetical protein